MDPELVVRNRSTLLDLRERLLPTVASIKESILADVRSAGDISNAPTHMATDDDEDVDVHVAMAENEEGILQEVVDALGRIENGIYGRCEGCGREIRKDRIAALPYARYCIDCAQKHDQGPELYGRQ